MVAYPMYFLARKFPLAGQCLYWRLFGDVPRNPMISHAIPQSGMGAPACAVGAAGAGQPVRFPWLRRTRRMACRRFHVRYTNKVDGKGGVSIPASFRAVLEAMGAATLVYLPGTGTRGRQ